jgi:hypothetical protein
MVSVVALVVMPVRMASRVASALHLGRFMASHLGSFIASHLQRFVRARPLLRPC